MLYGHLILDDYRDIMLEIVSENRERKMGKSRVLNSSFIENSSSAWKKCQNFDFESSLILNWRK
jgi:hypothetical protein